MKQKLQKAIFIIAAIHLFLLSCNAQNTSNSQFKISIWQNGKEKKISKNSVELQKKEFDIVFHFADANSITVAVNASFNSQTFKAAMKGTAFDKLPCFEPGRGMAEGVSNSERDILINDDAFNSWYYDSPNDNRFNSVKIDKDGVTAIRTVNKLWDSETGEHVGLSTAKSPLYLVFFAFDVELDSRKTEIHREYIKIKWE